MPETIRLDAVQEPSGPSKSLSISVKIENPEVLNEWLNLDKKFDDEYKNLFSKFIFETHKYLIRVTPIDTGQLRGGWTSYLDAHRIDYSRQIFDTSLAEKAVGREYHLTDAGVQEGRGMSFYDAPTSTDVTIHNAVPHGLYLEEGTSHMHPRNFLELARYKAETIFATEFDKWFKDMQEANDIVPSQDITDTTA
jgi:hypothetical protein